MNDEIFFQTVARSIHIAWTIRSPEMSTEQRQALLVRETERIIDTIWGNRDHRMRATPPMVKQMFIAMHQHCLDIVEGKIEP